MGLRGFTKIALDTWALATVALLVAGCAEPARTSHMQLTSPYWHAKFKDSRPVLAGSIGDVRVSGGAKTNPMWRSKVDNFDFARAVENSLDAAGLRVVEGKEARYSMDVELRELRQPLLGFDMNVTVAVEYTLHDNARDEEVYEERIVTRATATLQDNYYAPERIRMATEEAVQENIKKWLVALYGWRFEGEGLRD